LNAKRTIAQVDSATSGLVLDFDDSVEATVQTKVRDVLMTMGFPAGPCHVSVRVLSGGANNVNLCLQCGRDKWALKLRDPLGARFGVDARAAIDCQRAAAQAGVAPPVQAHLWPEGHFVSDFVDGETLGPDSIRDQRLAADIAKTLHRLHEVRGLFREFSIFEDIRTFLKGARDIGNPEPPDLADLLRIAAQMETIVLKTPAPRALCHNDLVPQNLMRASGNLLLVDFDYAGVGWVAADLAGMTSQAQMTAQETTDFLNLYDADADDGQRARVEMLRFSNALREVAWSLFAEPVLADKTTLSQGWSYQGHARMNLELAKAILQSRSAESLIAAAVHVRPSALF
jgi:thiamine kinase-like enzyme